MSIPHNKPRKGRVIRRWFRHKVESKPAGLPLQSRIRELERFILNAEERPDNNPRPGYLPPVDDPRHTARRGGLRIAERDQVSAERLRLWLGIGILAALAILLAAWLATRMQWL